MGYDCVFKWRDTPTVTGELVEFKTFKDLKKRGFLEPFGVLLKQLDVLDEDPKNLPDEDYVDEMELERRYDYILEDHQDALHGFVINGKLAGIISTHEWINKRKGLYNSYITDVSVLPEYAGQGVATLMIKGVMKGKEKYEWSLKVHDSNPKARAVYERLGFVASLTMMFKAPTKK